jgi:uncharacterized protein (DUF1786 family)
VKGCLKQPSPRLFFSKDDSVDYTSDHQKLDRLLAIDVGAGTQDILLYDSDKPVENCVKLVLPSMTTIVSERIKEATRQRKDVFLTGNLMGGGPTVSAIKKHLKAGFRVLATPLAAKTIRDDPAEVTSMGVEIVDQPPTHDVLTIQTRDVDLSRLRQALALFDVQLPELYAIAVQDHGELMGGGSNRQFRFQHWQRFVEAGGNIGALVYREVPEYMTRMKAVQRDVRGAIMMDTGSAAIWGALCDPVVAAQQDEGLIVVNVGNQHTIGALLQGERVWGLFEHHTVLMDTVKLAEYVQRLRSGVLSNAEVFTDHGHGATIHPDYLTLVPFKFVTVVGPNRNLAEPLDYYMAAPYGDMMLTGAFGLVAATRRLLEGA